MTDEKIALVTGAARGLGYVIAVALQASGARVVLADVSPTVTEAAETIGAAGAVQMDVAQYPAVESALTYINERYGAPDILVNTAGITTNIARTDLYWLLRTVVQKIGACARTISPAPLPAVMEKRLLPGRSRTGKPLLNENASIYLGNQTER